MLVLTRRCGEVIHLDGGIVIQVVSICAGHVRLGIEAPRETVIMRGELVGATGRKEVHDVG